MMRRRDLHRGGWRALGALALCALTVPDLAAGTAFASFDPLATSAPCVAGGPDASQPPLVLAPGHAAEVVATEGPGFPDQSDMHTLNETGRRAGRFLFHTHEVRENGAVSVTDLRTGVSTILAQRADWERLDGIRWTPWGTLLIGEEVRANRDPFLPDPDAPEALGGLVYEVDPSDGTSVVRQALGSRAHEGIDLDNSGNVYGVSEVAAGGAIYRFVPERRGDLSTGRLFALQVTSGSVDRTGEARWLPLDPQASVVDSDREATEAGATKYLKAEDLEVRGGALYVAISDEHRVIAIDLHRGRDAEGLKRAFVWDYVKAGLNAPPSAPATTGPDSFAGPDNLAFDSRGRLFIAEDAGGRAPGKTMGNDIWAATPPRTPGVGKPALGTTRFASLTDCNAEPSGIYFGPGTRTLFMHIMHRGGSAPGDVSLPDLSLRIGGVD